MILTIEQLMIVYAVIGLLVLFEHIYLWDQRVAALKKAGTVREDTAAFSFGAAVVIVSVFWLPCMVLGFIKAIGKALKKK